MSERLSSGYELAPYATDWRKSRGRTYDEPSAIDRTPYQRDRDRVIHSDAFRRLQYKTQVFSNQYAGDYRTRLTHSLEVAQITRTVCRSLFLDEDLGEVIALAHDLGHPPFGHSGEDALNGCMKDFGGFYHNDQTMRILRKLECRYGSFDGLNLSWEALEGIAKHNGPLPENCSQELYGDLEPQGWCGLEGQVAAMADDLAYNHHDIDDGLVMGKIQLHEIREMPQFNRVYEEVLATYPKSDSYRQIKETIRRMIARQVKDLLNASKANLKKVNPQFVEDVRMHKEAIIGFSSEVKKENRELKKFMFENVYRHYDINRVAFRTYSVIGDLFEAFMAHRRTLPPYVQDTLPKDNNDLQAKARVVADYISSLTDRSALIEHEKLYGSKGNI